MDNAPQPTPPSRQPATKAAAEEPARSESNAARLDAESTANQATGKDERSLPPGAEDPPQIRSHEREPAP